MASCPICRGELREGDSSCAACASAPARCAPWAVGLALLAGFATAAAGVAVVRWLVVPAEPPPLEASSRLRLIGVALAVTLLLAAIARLHGTRRRRRAPRVPPSVSRDER